MKNKNNGSLFPAFVGGWVLSVLLSCVVYKEFSGVVQTIIVIIGFVGNGVFNFCMISSHENLITRIKDLEREIKERENNDK